MTEVTTIGVQIRDQTRRGRESVSRSFREVRRDARDMDRAVESSGRSFTQVGRSAQRAQAPLQSSARSFERVQRSARGASRELESVNRSARGGITAFGRLGPAIGVAIGYFGAREIVNYADEWTNLTNRVRLFNDTAEETAFVQQQLFDISQRTRTGLAQTAQVYQRLAQANDNLGLQTSDLLAVLETVNQAVTVSGVSAESANSALVQFGQGLAADALRGQELNSVLEQVPRLAQAIADGLDTPIGQIRALAFEGQLTGANVIAALQDQADAVESDFGRVNRTVSQSLTQLGNATIRLIGTFSEQTGASRALADGITSLAQSFEGLADSTNQTAENLERVQEAQRALATGQVPAALQPGGQLPRQTPFPTEQRVFVPTPTGFQRVDDVTDVPGQFGGFRPVEARAERIRLERPDLSRVGGLGGGLIEQLQDEIDNFEFEPLEPFAASLRELRELEANTVQQLELGFRTRRNEAEAIQDQTARARALVVAEQAIERERAVLAGRTPEYISQLEQLQEAELAVADARVAVAEGEEAQRRYAEQIELTQENIDLVTGSLMGLDDGFDIFLRGVARLTQAISSGNPIAIFAAGVQTLFEVTGAATNEQDRYRNSLEANTAALNAASRALDRNQRSLRGQTQSVSDQVASFADTFAALERFDPQAIFGLLETGGFETAITQPARDFAAAIGRTVPETRTHLNELRNVFTNLGFDLATRQGFEAAQRLSGDPLGTNELAQQFQVFRRLTRENLILSPQEQLSLAERLSRSFGDTIEFAFDDQGILTGFQQGAARVTALTIDEQARLEDFITEQRIGAVREGAAKVASAAVEAERRATRLRFDAEEIRLRQQFSEQFQGAGPDVFAQRQAFEQFQRQVEQLRQQETFAASRERLAGQPNVAARELPAGAAARVVGDAEVPSRVEPETPRSGGELTGLELEAQRLTAADFLPTEQEFSQYLAGVSISLPVELFESATTEDFESIVPQQVRRLEQAWRNIGFAGVDRVRVPWEVFDAPSIADFEAIVPRQIRRLEQAWRNVGFAGIDRVRIPWETFDAPSIRDFEAIVPRQVRRLEQAWRNIGFAGVDRVRIPWEAYDSPSIRDFESIVPRQVRRLEQAFINIGTGAVDRITLPSNLFQAPEISDFERLAQTTSARIEQAFINRAAHGVRQTFDVSGLVPAQVEEQVQAQVDRQARQGLVTLPSNLFVSPGISAFDDLVETVASHVEQAWINQAAHGEGAVIVPSDAVQSPGIVAFEDLVLTLAPHLEQAWINQAARGEAAVTVPPSAIASPGISALEPLTRTIAPHLEQAWINRVAHGQATVTIPANTLKAPSSFPGLEGDILRVLQRTVDNAARRVRAPRIDLTSRINLNTPEFEDAVVEAFASAGRNRRLT